MSRVAVVGPGSVGVFFAAHLAAAGHEVLACARRPFERYVVESSKRPVELPAAVATDPAVVDAPFEWVLFCVKGQHTDGARRWLEVCCDESTRVLVVQNGLDHERLRRSVNGATLIPTVVYCGAELVEPGHIRHSSSGFLIAPDGPYRGELAALFEGGRADIRLSDDFVTDRWRKLGINVVANGLTGLTGRPMGVLADPHIRRLAEAMFEECWSVARADGASIDDDTIEPLLDAMATARDDGGTSMFYDVQAGRETEHDGIHGSFLRRAAKHGIDTPTVRTVHALLAARADATP